MIIFEAEGLPVKDFAVRTLTRTGLWIFEFDSFCAQSRGKLVHIIAMRGPTDEAWLLQIFDDRVLFYAGLLRVGCDDFKVATRI